MRGWFWYRTYSGHVGRASWCCTYKEGTAERTLGLTVGRGGWPRFLWSVRLWLWLRELYVVIG